jgi:hypothetical protein
MFRAISSIREIPTKSICRQSDPFEMYRKGENIRLKDVIIESPPHKGRGAG